MYAAAILLLAVVSVNAEAQFYGYPQYQDNYFRSGLVASSLEPKPDSRLFLGGFGTVTLTLATTTSTSVVTVSTTCTTSTTAISTCSPSGRRRRGVDSAKGRGLFYADEDQEADEKSIFLPWKPEEEPAAAAEEPKREAREASPAVPFVVQPGFTAPENLRSARFLVSFATSTAITTSTSTYTVRLSALCQSSTNFATCPGI